MSWTTFSNSGIRTQRILQKLTFAFRGTLPNHCQCTPADTLGVLGICTTRQLSVETSDISPVVEIAQHPMLARSHASRVPSRKRQCRCDPRQSNSSVRHPICASIPKCRPASPKSRPASFSWSSLLPLVVSGLPSVTPVLSTNISRCLGVSKKVQNLTVFSIIYMIRIRFFGPGELMQNGFRRA